MSEKGRYVGSYPVIMVVVVSKQNEPKRKVNVLIRNTCLIISCNKQRDYGIAKFFYDFCEQKKTN